MKKLYIALTCLICTTTLFAQFDKEVVCSDLKVIKNEDYYQFRGYTSDDILVELNLFACEYGNYTAQEVEGEMDYPIRGVFGKDVCYGEGVYSFSEEHKSDMLVATITVPEKGWTVKVTMYGKSMIPTDTIVVENVSTTLRGRGDLQQLVISGNDEVYGAVTFIIYHYNTMNTAFPTIAATIQSQDYVGEGTWRNQDDQQVLDAIFTSDETDKVFKVNAYTKTAPKVPSAIEDITIQQAGFKYIHNGQLIIIRNGVKYNASGAIQ